MKKTLSITVKNESGVLTRISSIFSSRGFNIESIAVGPTENTALAKIIITLPADEQTTQQLTKQLNKLIQVVEIIDLTSQACVERELMLLKIEVSSELRSEILSIVEIFRGKIVDMSPNSLTIEICGDPGKILAIQEVFNNYKIVEIVRTGKIAIRRELGINTEILKNYS